ncbi:MAG TPA: carboxypeptidase-like regulatory domain-containing protein [Terriglobia bacterium]|nr:carboxypeptidase-like regulatory domain-containing protein [Terriglobia bacterium]
MRTALLWIMLLAQAPAPAETGRGIVAGRILSPRGQPVREMRVAALEVSEGKSAGTSLLASLGQTDDQGRYRLEEIPPGRYYIVAGPLDNATYFPGVKTPAGAKPIEITSGSVVTEINFAAKVVTISGRVIGNDNPARAAFGLGTAAAIAMSPSTTPISFDSSRAISTAIAPDGTFEFRNVPPGNYSILLNSGHDYVVSIPPADRYSETVVHVDENDVSGVIVSLVNPVTIRVAMDRDGPLPPFTLELAKGDETYRYQHAASLRSFFAWTDPGSYRINIPDLPEGYAIRSIFYGAQDVTHAPATMNVNPEALTINLSASDPPPWGRIHGRVSMPSGTALRSIAVRFFRDSLGDFTADVAPDGAFDISLLPGEYRASVYGLFPDYILKTFGGGSLDLINGSLKVSARDVVDLKIEIERVQSVTIAGRVTGAKNLPASTPPLVDLVRIGRPERLQTSAGIDGTFAFKDLSPGFYQIGVPEDLAAARSQLIDADRDVNDIEIHIPRQIPITGRIIVENGAIPDLSAMIVVVQGPYTTVGAGIRPDGTFSLISTDGLQSILAQSIPAGFELVSITTDTGDVLAAEEFTPGGPLNVRIVLRPRKP